jgi:hypothetical protein
VEAGHVIGVITERGLFRLIVARETQEAQPSGEAAAAVS